MLRKIQNISINCHSWLVFQKRSTKYSEKKKCFQINLRKNENKVDKDGEKHRTEEIQLIV